MDLLAGFKEKAKANRVSIISSKETILPYNANISNEELSTINKYINEQKIEPQIPVVAPIIEEENKQAIVRDTQTDEVTIEDVEKIINNVSEL